MRTINYTCNKNWEEMDSLGSSSRYCSDCDLCVKDYSSENKDNLILTTSCGRFNLSQIDSFKRSYQINSFNLIQVSLMALLGLSLASAKAETRDLNLNKNNTTVVNDTNLLKIEGQLLNKETKWPLVAGAIELYNSSKLIGVDMTDGNGRFTIKVDSSKHEIKNLRVVFNRGPETSDTTKIKVKKSNEILIELKVYTDWASNTEYIITGDVTSVDDNVIDCHQRKEPKRAKAIKK